MFAAGAALGPFCDGLHSSGNVLHYTNPSIIQLGPVTLETCWWVPVLFGVAGLILGVSYPVLDELAAGHQTQQQQDWQPGAPGWPIVLLCISLFVLQYKLSAVLEVPLLQQYVSLPPGGFGAAALELPTIDIVLLLYALAHWRMFDATPQGFAMSTLTAVAGPLVEICLINLLGLYTYTHPQVAGVPTWIPWVYFCGGPAVGLLGRQVWATLKTR
eukprot:CAMPEP_0202906088 /NCGR_PEP_ID=MMETSP1392-20130828/37269_1 /ASSEMBLY_ACC=CAM_ASM_000868 /TAXON_ID=225041 /ORGANISM="Chlamydomonas chlamydogama, Strain SAG 11-48b" /LENGTH=214 /DNA_ID=CAMNT_0049594447 /DNA_START=174 /DNA_END=818 /DNA_ORIENTATION=-